MKKLEMIWVRSTPNAIADTLPRLTDHIDNLGEKPESFEIKTMKHGQNQGDIAVFIVWKSTGNSEKSREGLLVAELLQEIGALSHIVWMTERT